jgi:flagellar hook-associated protein 3 FlgL
VQRQVGPGVSMDIGIRGDSFLGNGADGKLLQVLRDTSAHLKANDGVAIRGDIQRLEDKADEVLGVRALNGAKQNRLEAALGRLQEIEGTTLQQLSDTEDVDIAKAMIEFSSQKAAYDAALKAGANIVQVSLMDFLR